MTRSVSFRPESRAWVCGIATCTLLVGCGGGMSPSGGPAHLDTPQGVVADAAPAATHATRRSGWRSIVTAADRTRLREWRTAWVSALAQLRPADIAANADLFAPDRVLDDPIPPAGMYRCRTFKLGTPSDPWSDSGPGPESRSPSRSGLRFVAYDWFSCRIVVNDRGPDAGVLRLIKEAGSQRPVGSIYEDGRTRGVFLGSMQLADERNPMRYGTDGSRDMAGLIERIGPRRWRLVLPYPRFESTLDVIELVPAN